MKYIKSIYERLSKETYLDVIRKSQKNQHFKRSSNIFQHTYNLGKFLMKPPDGVSYEQSSSGKIIRYPEQEFALLDMIPSPNNDKSVSISLKFRSDDYNYSMNLYINSNGQLDHMIKTFKDVLRSRATAFKMYRVLHEVVRDYYRDYIHDNDWDIRLLQNYDRSIEEYKIPDMYKETL